MGKDLSLAVPLSPAPIAAAERLHTRSRQWRASDDALHALAQRVPDFDDDAMILKSVAINTLCSTRVVCQRFHNTSEFDFASLKGDAQQIAANCGHYIRSLSSRARDLFEKFGFAEPIVWLDHFKGGRRERTAEGLQHREG